MLQKLGDHERGPSRPCIGGHTCAAIRLGHSEECDVGVSPEETSVHERLVRSLGRRPDPTSLVLPGTQVPQSITPRTLPWPCVTTAGPLL